LPGDEYRPLQGPDGSIDACFHLPALDPGHYTLELVGGGAERKHPLTSPHRGTTITLVPPAGPPGTLVHINGFYPGAMVPPPSPVTDIVAVCWDGCLTGLNGAGFVNWAPNGHFGIDYRVPLTAWLAADGPRPLVSGKHVIAIGCIGSQRNGQRGCGSATSDAEASFDLVAPSSQRCGFHQPCATLQIIPELAIPGEAVYVAGWAPTGVNGLVLKRSTSTASVPSNQRPKTAHVFASAQVTVLPGMQWHDLGSARPLLIQRNGLFSLASDLLNPNDLAYCPDTGIQISRDSGTTWTTFPTASLARVVAATDYPPLLGAYGLPIGCAGAVIDHDHRQSAWVSVDTIKRNQGGAPPSYLSGYFTTDGGANWAAVPIPQGATGGDFGGFRVSGNAVQALFVTASTAARAPGEAPSFSVVETSDGGHSWQLSHLRCPDQGPCVTWGPATPERCAAGGGQFIIYSRDAGADWATPAFPGPVNICSVTYLVSLNGARVLLLGGGTYRPFAAQVSQDGGERWEVVTLPRLPPTPHQEAQTAPQANLLLLPDGTLLAFGGGIAATQLLAPSARAWCAYSGPQLAASSDAEYEIIGNRLWWLPAKSVPLDLIHC